MFIRSRTIHTESVGIDASRIRGVVTLAMEYIRDYLRDPDFGGSDVRMWEDLHNVLTTGKIALDNLALPLPNSEINDMVLYVDMKLCRVSVRSTKQKKKRASLNTLLKAIR